MKDDEFGKDKYICSTCGTRVKQGAWVKNDGLCTPCKKKKDASSGKIAGDAPPAD